MRLPRSHRLSACIALAAFSLSVTVQADTTDAAALLTRAEAAYDRGLDAITENPALARAAFAESAATYRGLIDGLGIRNTALLANLGNASMLSGDVGHAVLSYRRAALLDPASPVARAGLAAARARVGTSVPTNSEGPWGRMGGVLLNQVGASTARTGAVAAWALGWFALAMTTVRPRWSAARPYAIGALLAGGLTITLLATNDAMARRSNDAVVITDGVIGRNGPAGAAYAPTFDKPLTAGVEVSIEESRHDWVRARLTDGRETWLPMSAVERVNPPSLAMNHREQ